MILRDHACHYHVANYHDHHEQEQKLVDEDNKDDASSLIRCVAARVPEKRRRVRACVRKACVRREAGGRVSGGAAPDASCRGALRRGVHARPQLHLRALRHPYARLDREWRSWRCKRAGA